MPGEPIIEKIPVRHVESLPNKEGKDLASENKAESFLVKTEPKIVPEKKVEKVNDLNIGAVSSTQNWQTQRAIEIDHILADGLSDIFLKMNPREQSVFKKAGEETVAQINILLSATKVKVNKIIDLIKKWLKLLPGINKFFLEQEAKIKTDKIIRIKNKF